MDMMSLLADQERRGFADLAGSGGQGVVRVSERLLNAAIAQMVAGDPRAARDATRRRSAWGPGAGGEAVVPAADHA